jgi:uncharacterized protein (DUF608 family)
MMRANCLRCTEEQEQMPTTAPSFYTGKQLAKISFPLGGIGTGSVGLSGSGRLIDWEIYNRPAKGSTNGFSHFAIRAEHDGTVLDARILNGPYLGDRTGDFMTEELRNYGNGARRDSLAGMPHFQNCRFDGRFPIAGLRLTDPQFPGEAEITALNPFIPQDDKNSSIPAAMFAITLFNSTDTEIDYTVTGVLGHGPVEPTRAEHIDLPGMSGVRIVTDDIALDRSDYSELMIATDAPVTSHQTYLYDGMWFDALQVYWNDILRPGPFRDRLTVPNFGVPGMRRSIPHSLHAAHVTVPAGERRTLRFVIAWYAPNFSKSWQTPIWHSSQQVSNNPPWPNWYATEWMGVADVARHVLVEWEDLFTRTGLFRDTLYSSTLPLAVLDAAAANLSILKTATTVRLTDGSFYGWEGLFQDVGSCEGSCSHVWNYQQALPFLFPALERSMRELDYVQNTDDAGGMSFRMSLPLGTRGRTERPAADGQFGGMMKLYRDWKLSGDDAFLSRLWPIAKRTVEYAWSPTNPDLWDPEKSGVLWGRQHHTLDMELFGPNVWLTGFYLGALKAGEAIAEYLGDPETSKEWRAIHDKGRAWIDANLFNGEYYVQRLDLYNKRELDPYAESAVSRRFLGATVYDLYWSSEHGQIKYQLGEGCAIDQMLAQWHANLYGLGALLDQNHVVSTLQAIDRHNHKPRLGDIANPCRVFGLEDEGGTLICAWPAASPVPAVPVPYSQETMHGFEYAFGCAMMQYGMLDAAVRVFRSVRDRYDGIERNPWNEIECGSNYSRSMASWAAVPTLSGFSFDAQSALIGFAPMLRNGPGWQSFWSTGSAWGRADMVTGGFALTVLAGKLPLAILALPIGDVAATATLNDQKLEVQASNGALVFPRINLVAGETLRVRSAALTLDGLRDISSF